MKKSTRIFSMPGLLITVLAAFMISLAATAQSPQQILNALDADSSGAISKDEAVDDMKANFSFIDSNGDGGIDSRRVIPDTGNGRRPTMRKLRTRILWG